MNPAGRRGTTYGLAAYLLWGVFPLYFHALRHSGPIEILLHRVLWSFVVCVVILTATRSWGQVRAVAAVPADLMMLALASALLAINWGVYVYAVNSGHVIEASLGYYINPLVTVLLGVLLLQERLRSLQWAAVGVGAAAVAVLTAAYGRPPWVALTLALSFGGYGLIKNRIGGSVGALASMSTETVVIVPFAVGGVIWLQATGQGSFTDHAPVQGVLLASTGIATVIPLLLFAAAARRVPLSTMGLLQYLTPSLQLLCGVLFLGEHMPASRWFGFGLVWIALVLLTGDSLAAARRRSRDRQDAPPVALIPAASAPPPAP